MGKKDLYCDADGVILDSVPAICKTYNYLYQYHKNFKPAKPEELKTWNMKEIIPLCDNCEELFEHELFFKYVQMMPNAKEVLFELSKIYNLHIVTIGSLKNIANKAMYFKEHLSFIKNIIFIYNGNCTMNKDGIVMNNGILIDDHQDNLKNPTCDMPIAFGKTYEWNKDFKGVRCENWEEVRELLIINTINK